MAAQDRRHRHAGDRAFRHCAGNLRYHSAFLSAHLLSRALKAVDYHPEASITHRTECASPASSSSNNTIVTRQLIAVTSKPSTPRNSVNRHYLENSLDSRPWLRRFAVWQIPHRESERFTTFSS